MVTDVAYGTFLALTIPSFATLILFTIASLVVDVAVPVCGIQFLTMLDAQAT